MTRRPASVLFACTSNVIRSAMAEALVKRYFGADVYADSAGVQTADPDGFAIEVMDELGIDLSRHRPKVIDDLNDTSFDLVVSLSLEAKDALLSFARANACDVEHWPTPDPSVVEGARDIRLNAYRAVRDELQRRIRRRFAADSAPVV